MPCRSWNVDAWRTTTMVEQRRSTWQALVSGRSSILISQRQLLPDSSHSKEQLLQRVKDNMRDLWYDDPGTWTALWIHGSMMSFMMIWIGVGWEIPWSWVRGLLRTRNPPTFWSTCSDTPTDIPTRNFALHTSHFTLHVYAEITLVILYLHLRAFHRW